jgi:outer membrane lipoprotein-sorting protein
MKSFFRLSLATIAVTLFFSVLTATETKAQAALQDILNRMDNNNKTLQTLRSNVTMVKYNSQLKESDVTEGKAIYLPSKGRDAYVRIDWVKPVQEILAVVNGEYILYRPRLNQAIVGKVKNAQGSGKANNALAFINMSKAQLKANYAIKFLGAETVSSGTEAVRLELTPKNASPYKVAELWVDKDGMPVQAKVIENNNDATTVLLYKLEKNVTINAGDFSVKLPKNTKKIEG